MSSSTNGFDQVSGRLDGSPAGFLSDLARSDLFAPADVPALVAAATDSGAAADPAGAAKALVRTGHLTPYQAKLLLRGKARGFLVAGKYKLLELIGTGGMGAVYLCEHVLLRRPVALKVLLPTISRDPLAVERFLREARAVAALDHPNVVKAHDIERLPKGYALAMEYVDGVSLRAVVGRSGPLSPARAAHYAAQAAAGLDYAHQAGWVHRDVKPDNLLLDRQGVVKVLDLGLARLLTDRADQLTRRENLPGMMGTADFVAPEQAADSTDVDARTDVYSLGATLYYLLTGGVPFPADTVLNKLLAHRFDAPAPIRAGRPDVPAELAAVVDKMMAKAPADRYQSMAEVAAALAPWTAAEIGPPPADEMVKQCPAVRALLDLTAKRGGSSAGNSRPPGRPAGQSTLRGHQVTLPDATPPAAPTRARAVWAAVRARKWAAAGAGMAAAGVAAAVAVTALLGGRGGDRPAPAALAPAAVAPTVAARPAPVPAVAVAVKAGGSTFVKPMMDHWARLYEAETGVKVGYEGTGSTKGIAGVTGRFLDFGATDAPMSDQQMADAGGDAVHVPLVLGAVVPTYNLAGPAGRPVGLRFTGPLLANIYLGKVTRWDDPAIAVCNPGLALPAVPIAVVRRKEGSGTTAIWTDYLSKVSGEWKDRVGAGTAVKWPVGEPAEKNDGVADAVSRTPGAIGYVELSFALANGLSVGEVKNRDGRFVAPSLEGVTAAAAGALRAIPADLRYSLTDAPGPDSWPIAGTAWAVACVGAPGGKGADVAKFLRWALHDGQGHVKALRYAPLPADLVARADELVARVAAGR